MKHERKRLIADRFRRIWGVVEEIAANPGGSRRELADKFFVSERQMQADLNIIRADMRLPLVRSRGYRFADEGGGSSLLDLREAQLLVMILRQASRDRSLPRDQVGSLMEKLPYLFPPHLQPLVARTIDAARGAQGSKHAQVFAVIGEALLRGAAVKLHYAADDYSCVVRDPVVTPERLIPYLDRWYVIGACRQRQDRSMMFDISDVQAVTVADAAPEPAVRMGRAS